MTRRELEAQKEYNDSKSYFDRLGCKPRFDDCKCKGNGWCELHDHFDPYDDSYAI